MSKVTRRGFLKSASGAAAGAIAFPYIIPSSALGADGAVAPSNRVVMAAIGVGGQGTYNMKALMGQPEVQMIAVCDVDAGHREAAKGAVNEQYGNQDCATYNDFRDVLTRGDIDAVTCCTPDHWHGLISVAAAKAGKDIYCEKPLVNTIQEGRAVCDAVTQYGRVLQTGSHERSRHNARFACELVRNQRIGKLVSMTVNLPKNDWEWPSPNPPMPVPEGFDYDFWLGPCPYETYTEKRCHFWFRYILDYSGGEMTDRGAHVIDIAQLANGSDDTGPVEIKGTGVFPREGMFNTAYEYSLELTYANGVKMYVTDKEPRGVKFQGTDGWVFVHIHGGNLEADPPSLLTETILANEVQLGRSPGHHADFINAVKNRSLPMAPAEVGHRSATICHLCNIAMTTGKTLHWDPVTERITNDEQANRMTWRPMRGTWSL